MILSDIGAELVRLLAGLVAVGDLEESAARVPISGTWRPAPIGEQAKPGTYATSLPFVLAGHCSGDHARLAAVLADGLAAVPWIAEARATGGGYITVTVTTEHLAALASRIIAVAGGCLAGASPSGTAAPDAGRMATGPIGVCGGMAKATTWERAWQAWRNTLVARFAKLAMTRPPVAGASAAPTPTSAENGPPAVGPVATAISHYGLAAVRYALARTSKPTAIEAQLRRPLDLANPFVLVRYACQDSGSVRRWAQELELEPTPSPAGRPPESPRDWAPEPAELRLLDALSWLPERVAAAARRGRPAEFTTHLENVAEAWLTCREECPALPFGGRRSPADPSGPVAGARMALAEAVRRALVASLGLLCVEPLARMERRETGDRQ